MFGLYVAGIVGALVGGWCCADRLTKGAATGAVHDGTAQATRCRAARACDRPVAARQDLPAARRHDHLQPDWCCCGFCSTFPQPPDGATEPAIDYSLAGHDRRWAGAAAGADRLQLADRGGADPGHGGARSGGRGARHRLRHRGRRGRRPQQALGEMLAPTGAWPPRWRSWPGSSSRRNASRRWR